MDQRRGIFRHAITASFNPFLPSSIGIKMRGSLDMVQRLKLETRLKIHDGCVNTICWNERGDLLLSGSDDHHLCVSNPFSKKVVHSIHSGHRANIFSAKFLPNTQDKHIVSCSGDGMIYFTDLEAFEVTGASNSFDCHNGTTAYEVLTVPQDPHSFLSCGEDGTVRWFDLRIKDKCSKSECKEDVLIHCRRAITAISINPLLPYQLAVGCSDSSVRVFDRRMLGTRATGNYTGRGITGMVSRFCAPSVEKRPHRITSLEYSPDGEEVLVSYSSEHLYLFNIREDHTKDKVLKKEAEPSSSRQPAEEGAEGGEGSNNKQQPPVKKLRLRGDWSDTGPDARPESERGSTEQGSSNIMQRMSDMLTRWFEGINRQQDENSPQGREGEGQSQREPESEEGGEQNQEGAASATQNDAEDKKDDSDGKKDGSDEKPEDEKQKDSVEKELGATCDSKSDVNDLGQSVPKLSLEVADAAKGLVTLESDSSASAGTMSSSITESQSPTSGQSIPTSPKEMPERSSDSCQAVAAGMATCASPMETDQTVSQSSQKPCEAMDLSTDSISVPTSQDCDNAPSDPNQSHDTADFQRSRTSQDDTGTVTGQEGAAGEESGEGASADSLVNQPHASRFLIVPSGVRNVEQHLQQQEYTPVISLHYCAAGTSTSTIKVDFTALNQRQAADVANQSSVLHIQRPAGGATTRLTPSPLDSGPPGQPPVTQISEGQGEGQGQGRDEQVQGDQGQVGPAEDISPSSSAERKDDAPRETALETSETTQETGDIKTDSSSTVQESGQQNIRVLSRPVPSISIEHDSSMPSENDEPSAGEPMDTGSGPNSVAAEQNNEETDAAGASSTSSSAKPDPPTRSQAGSSGRQRRHGHSGPPTGNFQLHSGSGSSDDDSDTEATPEPPRTRGAATGLDRHLAAVRLQQLYRRRQEQLEKEEQGLNNVHQPRIKQCYRGHRNARTMIKEANFWGERYVMSGSDCGHIFIWDRYTSRLEMLLEADRHVVNCLQPHPVYPVLASSGIDYDVKLWMPTAAENQYNISVADEVIKRNQVMLEETRDTITVPASFMLRMLASLNHLRTGRRAFAGDRESNSDSTDDDH